MLLKNTLDQKLDEVSNLIKPLARPWLSWLFLNPSIKLLLETTTVEAAYGRNQKRLRPFPSETVATPEVDSMPPFEPSFKYLEGPDYTTHDIFTTVLEGVFYDPGNGIVLTKSRKILAESLFPNMDQITIFGAFLNKDFVLRKFFQKPVKVIPGYSSVYQGLPNGYYHKIIDLVPRCYLLNQPEYTNLDEIKLLYAEPLAEVEKLMVPRLVPSNVRLTCLPPGKLYYLEKLILPTFLTQFGAGYLPAPYIKKIRDEFLPKRPSTRKNRIYISRAKSANQLKKRHILNEEELFGALSKFGFERYQLENYTLEEKIELFYDAETVVGAYGGGLTHILFSDKVNVLELQVMELMQTYYYYLAKSLRHNFRYLCSDKLNNRENFSVDVSKVVQILGEWHSPI